MFETLISTGLTVPLFCVAVFALAGIVKGVVGLGLPTVSMALLALWMPPAQAAALLIVPSFVTNVWQLWPLSTLGPLFKRILRMQYGVLAGTLAGAWLLGAPAGAWARVLLGATLILYAAWGLSGAYIRVPTPAERWLGPVMGAITGLVTAATGVFVIPAVAYLQALGLERDELVQAMGISFTVSTVALAIGLYLNQQYPSATLWASTLALLPALAGMWVGQRLRSRLSPRHFRACLLVSLLALGGHMMLRDWHVG